MKKFNCRKNKPNIVTKSKIKMNKLLVQTLVSGTTMQQHHQTAQDLKMTLVIKSYRHIISYYAYE